MVGWHTAADAVKSECKEFCLIAVLLIAFTSGTAGRRCFRGSGRGTWCSSDTAGRPCCEKEIAWECLRRVRPKPRAGMALQTDREQNRPLQEAGVGGPVREVAGFAAIDANGGVLEQEWPAFVGVALQARLFIGQRLIDHTRPCAHAPGRGGRAVRIVAIRAGHDAFIHAMLGRHVELRANRGVAVVAEVRLLLGEESFRADRSVNRMAIGTDDVVLRVLRAANLGAADIFGVAVEAVIQNPFGGSSLKAMIVALPPRASTCALPGP